MLAVIDCRVPNSILRALHELGHTPILMPPHPDLPAPVASHPDMVLFFGKNKIVCTEKYAEIAKRELEIIQKEAQMPLCIIKQSVSPVYPNDILLNALRVGNYLFCKQAYTAPALFEETDMQICNVKQGYAKCSAVPIGENALITADPSIAKAAKQVELDVLQICQGAIRLDGYDTGLIGGACTYAPYQSLRHISFCGNWRLHPDAERIEEFCKKHHRIPTSLTDDSLIDLGTVFLI